MMDDQREAVTSVVREQDRKENNNERCDPKCHKPGSALDTDEVGENQKMSVMARSVRGRIGVERSVKRTKNIEQ